MTALPTPDGPPSAQLDAEIAQLRAQFPRTADLYREVCVLLFFRYGITPTANKLYQLVKKGSMSAPADALAAFWATLREKSRVRIESPDLPDEIKGALAETKVNGLRRDYLIGQIARKLNELDRHIVQAQELRARLVCASNELKARMQSGAKCDAGSSTPPPIGTNKPRPAPRVHRRSPQISG